MSNVKKDEPVFPENTYYDILKKEYLLPRPTGGWLPLNETQFRRHLKAMGYRSDRDRNEYVSPLDAALNGVQLDAAVDYSGPLAGYRSGFYSMQGRQVLVTSSPNIIEPAAGSFETIDHLLMTLLDYANNKDQLAVIYGWLKVFYDALRQGQVRTGQVLFLTGPKNCGKSLLQNLLTVIMGGRSAKPYQFALGGTAFNADLFQAEHLVVEDEQPSSDMRTRRMFGTFLKGIAANQSQRLHGKNKDGLTLEPLWRVSVSVNDDPEHLLVLPPLDESLLDKVIVFRCVQPSEPFNDGTPEGRRDYWQKLVDEIPAFLDFLCSWDIPPEYRCSRFGIKAYVNPDVADALLDLSDEMRLLNLCDMAQIYEGGYWQGTSDDLERKLRDDTNVGRDVARLLTWQKACGTYLGRLAHVKNGRVRYVGKLENRHTYRIDLP
jgi:energy-coupling factor transporter ATP-binding protein EcfA2